MSKNVSKGKPKSNAKKGKRHRKRSLPKEVEEGKKKLIFRLEKHLCLNLKEIVLQKLSK